MQALFQYYQDYEFGITYPDPLRLSSTIGKKIRVRVGVRVREHPFTGATNNNTIPGITGEKCPQVCPSTRHSHPCSHSGTVTNPTSWAHHTHHKSKQNSPRKEKKTHQDIYTFDRMTI